MSQKRDLRSGALFSCSFCGKSDAEVEYLIAGPSVNICTECIDICNDIVAKKRRAALAAHENGRPGPQQENG